MSNNTAFTVAKWVYGEVLAGFQFIGRKELALLGRLYQFNASTANHSVHVMLRTKEMIERVHRLPNGQTFTWMKLMSNSGIAHERLLRAALLHDVGKIRIPKEILFKPGRYTTEERSIVEQHEQHSKEMLAEAGFHIEAEIVGQHHNYACLPPTCSFYFPQIKKWLAVADILHLADVHTALLESRTYKTEYSPLETLAIICKDALDGKIDGESACFHVKAELKKVNQSYRQRLESSDWQEIVNLACIDDLIKKEWVGIEKAVNTSTAIILPFRRNHQSKSTVGSCRVISQGRA